MAKCLAGIPSGNFVLPLSLKRECSLTTMPCECPNYTIELSLVMSVLMRNHYSPVSLIEACNLLIKINSIPAWYCMQRLEKLFLSWLLYNMWLCESQPHQLQKTVLRRISEEFFAWKRLWVNLIYAFKEITHLYSFTGLKIIFCKVRCD